MEKISKFYRLSPDEVKVIQQVQEIYGYTTEVKALSHIIREYENLGDEEKRSEKIARAILRVFDEQYKGFWKRLYFSARQTDKNMTVLMDIVNSYLIDRDFGSYVSQDTLTAPVIEEAREHLKTKISKRKQMKDNRSRKYFKKE